MPGTRVTPPTPRNEDGEPTVRVWKGELAMTPAQVQRLEQQLCSIGPWTQAPPPWVRALRTMVEQRPPEAQPKGVLYL